MSEVVRSYFGQLSDSIQSVRVSDGKGRSVDSNVGLHMAAELAFAQVKAGHKIIFIGNGGSAAIASHMATDYFKNGGNSFYYSI